MFTLKVLLNRYKLLTDSNGTRTNNRLVCKRIFKYSSQLEKGMSCVVAIYLYGTSDYIFLLFHVHILERIQTLKFLESQRTLFLKEAQNIKFKWTQQDSNQNHRVQKQKLNHLVKLIKWLNCVMSTYIHGTFDCCSHHVRYASQSESMFYSCVTLKKHFVQSRYKIWCLSEYNMIPTDNYSLLEMCPYSELFWPVFSCILTEYGEIRSISPYSVRMLDNMYQNNSEYGHFLRSDWVCQKTLNHLDKLAKWLSCVVSAYLYGSYDCMLLSCHTCILEWIHAV